MTRSENMKRLWADKAFRMSRSENMKRLWTDKAFRARRSAWARANIARVNARRWADPEQHARASERVRLWHRARYLEYLRTFAPKELEDT
jgi:hypothetical protein